MNDEWITWSELVDLDYITNENLLKSCEDGILSCYNKEEKLLISTKKCSFIENPYPAIMYGRFIVHDNAKIKFTDFQKLENNIYVKMYDIFNFYFNSTYNEFYILRKDIFPKSYDIMAYKYILAGLPCSKIIFNIFERDMSGFFPKGDIPISYPTNIKTSNFISMTDDTVCHLSSRKENGLNYEELYNKEYHISYKEELDIGFVNDKIIKIYFNKEERTDYKKAVNDFELNKLEGFNYDEPFYILNCVDDSVMNNSNIWELAAKHLLTINNFINRRIVIINNGNNIYPSDLKYLFECSREFDVDITTCNEQELKHIVITSSYRTIEKYYYDENAIPIEFRPDLFLLYNGYPNKKEYIDKVVFPIYRNFKFKKHDIIEFIKNSIHIDSFLIRSYIKAWKKYCNEKKIL